jgi:hypothetical protein
MLSCPNNQLLTENTTIGLRNCEKSEAVYATPDLATNPHRGMAWEDRCIAGRRSS